MLGVHNIACEYSAFCTIRIQLVCVHKHKHVIRRVTIFFSFSSRHKRIQMYIPLEQFPGDFFFRCLPIHLCVRPPDGIVLYCYTVLCITLTSQRTLHIVRYFRYLLYNHVTPVPRKKKKKKGKTAALKYSKGTRFPIIYLAHLSFYIIKHICLQTIILSVKITTNKQILING